MNCNETMLERILSFAREDERIRVVTLEGSRTNRNVPRDEFQDYDVTFLVTKMEPFINDEGWLDRFGTIVMMQKPEAMELFPAVVPGYSFLMIFDDYTKVDLTLRKVDELDVYLKEDKLVQVLLDKDGRIKDNIIPTDEDYHITKPTARSFDDCCNEFWFVSTYVVKGLCRREILFAIDHLNNVLRPELLRMISWKVGTEKGFTFSLGKNYKYLDKHIPKALWERLLSTYNMASYEDMWRALTTCQDLFRDVSKEVAEYFRYEYPDYDRVISSYTNLHLTKKPRTVDS